MRVSSVKIILALSGLVIPFVACAFYVLYFVATVIIPAVDTVFAGIAGIGESVAIAIIYFAGAILFLCLLICCMLNSLDLVRFLLQFLAFPGA
jgi:hypothetical protein